MIRLACLLVISLALPFMVSAEETRIDGQWSFKAWTGDGCSFTGNATLVPPANSEEPYACELTARQVCTDREWIVCQTCTATRKGNRVAIKSSISEFISEPSESYLPDDFLLTIDTSKRMFGALYSYGVYKAVWTREIGDIS